MVMEIWDSGRNLMGMWLNNAMSQANGYTFYIVRNAPRVIKLVRRRNLTTTFNRPSSQTVWKPVGAI